jgi:DNA replication protein DnaC
MTDAAKLPMMLTELRMPTIGRLWQDIGATADREGWGAARFLAALCEHEIAERSQRRIGRHLAESGLQPGKTLATFDFAAAPSVRKPHIEALATGATWIEAGSNILIFGPSGTGKTHVAAAIGAGLIDNGYRVLFTRTTDLVQRLQAARRDLILPATLAKLDKFDCLILDDLGYVRKDQAETTVLFELIAERYERKSLAITCNQPFSEWDKVFPDPAVTVAAIDRLVHHSTIIEINTDSYRRRAAAESAAARKATAEPGASPRTRAKATT